MNDRLDWLDWLCVGLIIVSAIGTVLLVCWNL